ncbi:Oxidase ustYa [Cladobotryum mycophilum]|uniref:Oxidase ustYa n=1 Tax=Cladobotryum mycophilum TaxID=491253 RepID=A0ABR0SWY4_9HYPO
MHPDSTQYVAIHDGTSRSSEDSLTLAEVEKQSLFDPRSRSGLPPRKGSKIWSRESISWIISGILALVNLALLVAFLRERKETEIEPQKSWLPPENPLTSLFEFQTVFGAPLNNESEAAWNELMPIGRGFVVIKNDTVLPDQPGLNQSIVEQKAMVSVFHQLHCLYMAREGYYSAVEGKMDHVSKAHLTHCFDYLRQTIMCFGDTTLEWLPAPPNDTGSTGWGFEHTCRDFKAISEWAEENRLKTTFGIH